MTLFRFPNRFLKTVAFAGLMLPLICGVQPGRASGSGRQKIGLFFYSGDPTTDAHVMLVSKAVERFGLDRVIVVPAGNNPVHGKNYTFTPEERLQISKRKFGQAGNLTFWDGEVNGQTRYTYDTLEQIKATLSGTPEFYFLAGEDLFETLPKFKNKESLLKHNWVVARRPGLGGLDTIDLPPELMSGFHRIDEKHLVSDSGAHLQVIDFGLPDLSSTQIRKRYAGTQVVHLRLDGSEPQNDLVKRVVFTETPDLKTDSHLVTDENYSGSVDQIMDPRFETICKARDLPTLLRVLDRIDAKRELTVVLSGASAELKQVADALAAAGHSVAVGSNGPCDAELK